MNAIKTKKTGFTLALFAVSLMTANVSAQDVPASSLENEIAQQGDMALAQMRLELEQRAFWNKPEVELLELQLQEQALAPATATVTGCGNSGISLEQKKTPVISPAVSGQPG